MMSAARYAVLAVTTLAIATDAFGNEASEAERADLDAWEIAWNVALYEHQADRRNKPAFSRRRNRSDAWEIYKRARTIYVADWAGHVAAAGENLQFAMQIFEDARMKCSAAYTAEWAAKSAAASAAREIYETGRERNIAAWEHYQTAVRMYEVAKRKREAAYKAERAALRAIRDANSEARSAARNAIEKANRATGGR